MTFQSHSRQLVVDYGQCFTEKNLQRMIHLPRFFLQEIVVSAIQPLIFIPNMGYN
jgi:hypothetical protein